MSDIYKRLKNQVFSTTGCKVNDAAIGMIILWGAQQAARQAPSAEAATGDFEKLAEWRDVVGTLFNDYGNATGRHHVAGMNLWQELQDILIANDKAEIYDGVLPGNYTSSTPAFGDAPASGEVEAATSEPLPCPFCGNQPDFMPHPDPDYPQVQCRNIECPIGVVGDEVSLESWNQRAYTRPPAKVPEMKQPMEAYDPAEQAYRMGWNDCRAQMLTNPTPATTPQPQGDGLIEPDLFWDYDNGEDSGQESAYELADYCASDMPAYETMVVDVMCAKRLPNRKMKIWIDENDDLQWEWVSPQPPVEQEGE